jgi:hypothetical protein
MVHIYSWRHTRTRAWLVIEAFICFLRIIIMTVQSFVEPWPFFSFLILSTVGRTPWAGDQPYTRPLPTHRTTQTQNKRIQYRHPWLEWDSNPRSSVRESEDSYTLDRAATVNGSLSAYTGESSVFKTVLSEKDRDVG